MRADNQARHHHHGQHYDEVLGKFDSEKFREKLDIPKGVWLAMLDILFEKETQLRVQGDFAGALQVLNQAISLHPDCSAAHNNKGAILLLQGRYEEAHLSLERAVALDPRNGQAHNNLGWCYRMLGRTEDAVKELKRALSNGYVHEGVHYNLGVALLNLGRCQEGMDHFIAALRINPAYGPVLRDLAKIGTNYGGISRPTTIADAEKIKAALDAWGNPIII